MHTHKDDDSKMSLVLAWVLGYNVSCKGIGLSGEVGDETYYPKNHDRTCIPVLRMFIQWSN